MTPVPSNPLPQAAPPTRGASQTDAANNNPPAEGQGGESFAQVLSRRVDGNDSSTGKGETAQANAADKGSAADAPQAAAPAPDAVAAILSLIPPEVRTTGVTERAAMLSAGVRGVDAQAVAMSDIAKTAMPAAAALKAEGKPAGLALDGATDSAALGKQQPETAARAVKQDDFGATLKAAGEKLATEQQPVDATRLETSRHSAPSADPSTSSMIPVAQQGAAPQAAGANQTTSTQSVATPLGNPAWGDDFSQKINWLVGQKTQVAELHLNPPNLGPLDVSLKISDNQATLLFTSPHAQVRDAVENALPKLRELLADNGIMLGNASVGDQAPRDQQAGNFSGGTGRQAGTEQEVADVQGVMRTTTIRRHNGVLDTFA